MEQRKRVLVGSGLAVSVLLASSSLRAADVDAVAAAGIESQVGDAVEQRSRSGQGHLGEEHEEGRRDAADQRADSAKAKAKDAPGQAIDAIGPGADTR